MQKPSIDDLTRRYSAIAIHFWAPWDGHDPPMDRSIQMIRGRFAGRVHFVSCNNDLEVNAGLVGRCGVVNIPALGILVAGVPRRPIIGLRDPEVLASEIEARLRDPEPKRWWQFRARRDGKQSDPADPAALRGAADLERWVAGDDAGAGRWARGS